MIFSCAVNPANIRHDKIIILFIFASVFLYVSGDNDYQLGLLGQVGLNDYVPAEFACLCGDIFHLQCVGITGLDFVETPMDVIR
jgi:hypothetical protein